MVGEALPYGAQRRVAGGQCERDQQGRDFCLRNLDRGIAAAARVPPGTLLLRSDKLTPDELADPAAGRVRLTPAEIPDEVLTRVGPVRLIRGRSPGRGRVGGADFGQGVGRARSEYRD